MGRVLWRATVVTHRYLGVAVGLLMLVWFLSGIVMMYVPYPGVAASERLRMAAPIPWQSCCSLAGQPYGDGQPIESVTLRSLAGEPVLDVTLEGAPARLTSVGSAGPSFTVDQETARIVGLVAAEQTIGDTARLADAEIIGRDQWTVGEAGAGHRPLYRYRFDDAQRTTFYVSGTTGEVVQWTRAAQRFWNWFGAVPHWLYFTELRANVPLWSQIIIWTSLVGAFLTVLGLYLGIAQLKPRASGRLSPYRGWFYWHHIAGLVFGVVTLTWAISGTFSMTPFGLFVGEPGDERVRLQGAAPPWSAFRESLQSIQAAPPSGDVVRLTSAPLGGTLFWLARHRNGAIQRLDADGKPAPLGQIDLTEAAKRLAGADGILSEDMIAEDDAYYFEFFGFADRDPLPFPVYRIIVNDSQSTRYYLDAQTGALLRKADAAERGYRWWFSALHRFDFAAWIRARPVWDIVVLFLMLGGTAATATGVYLAWYRIKRDLTFKR